MLIVQSFIALSVIVLIVSQQNVVLPSVILMNVVGPAISNIISTTILVTTCSKFSILATAVY